MKTLNKTAEKTFRALIAGLTPDASHRKIDKTNGAFMPVSVEWIGERGGMNMWSVAHYGEQNGDLMSDPEMTFLDVGHCIIPLTFTNHYVGRYTEAVVDFAANGMPSRYRVAAQADITSFANTWMRNIKQQQGIKAPRKVAA